MPVLIIAALLLLALLYVSRGRWLPRDNATRSGPCRWKQDRSRRFARESRFVCSACGHEAFTKNGRPPRACVSALRAQGKAI